MSNSPDKSTTIQPSSDLAEVSCKRCNCLDGFGGRHHAERGRSWMSLSEGRFLMIDTRGCSSTVPGPRGCTWFARADYWVVLPKKSSKRHLRRKCPSILVVTRTIQSGVMARIDIEHLDRHDNGIVLRIPRSKMNPTGDEQELVALPNYQTTGRCPVTVITAWRQATGIDTDRYYADLPRSEKSERDVLANNRSTTSSKQ